jgi:hypothetical protein
MSRPVEVTSEHLQRAYAQMRKPGTPSLDELRSYWALFNCIRGRAVGIAEGKVLPPEPVATAPPTDPPPPRPPAPQRRRDDAPAPFSTRAAAAGEYVHPDDESPQ